MQFFYSAILLGMFFVTANLASAADQAHHCQLRCDGKTESQTAPFEWNHTGNCGIAKLEFAATKTDKGIVFKEVRSLYAVSKHPSSGEAYLAASGMVDDGNGGTKLLEGVTISSIAPSKGKVTYSNGKFSVKCEMVAASKKSGGSPQHKISNATDEKTRESMQSEDSSRGNTGKNASSKTVK